MKVIVCRLLYCMKVIVCRLLSEGYCLKAIA